MKFNKNKRPAEQQQANQQPTTDVQKALINKFLKKNKKQKKRA